MIYIVLGMHKSGTTLVSQLLHRPGLEMGEGFEHGRSYDQGTQWERREAFLVNLDLVGAREAAYFSLNHYTEIKGLPSSAQASAMREIILQCASKGDHWGFKEPLTCLTYSAWKSVLPEHRVVGVYRSPLEVMNHYMKNYRARLFHPGEAWRVLRAWSQYNTGMMTAVEAAGPDGIVVRYEELMAEDSDFATLEKFIGLPLVDIRSPAQYRAPSKNPLYGLIDPVMGIASGQRPSRILKKLEEMRKR